jgi:hypothetical protein
MSDGILELLIKKVKGFCISNVKYFTLETRVLLYKPLTTDL